MTQRPCGAGENCWWTANNYSIDHDPRLCQKFTTLSDVSPAQTAAELYGYSADAYNNLTDTYEYDYGKGPAPSTSCQAVSTGWTRHTNTVFNTSASYTANNIVRLPQETKIFDGVNNLYSDTKYGYDEYSNPATPIYNCPGVIGHDNQNYAGSNPRGNRTTLSRYLSTGGAWLNTYTAYDVAGNARAVTDPAGHTTSFSFNDNYTDGQNRSTYGFVTSVTNALGQIAFQANYDYGTGQPVLTADIRGQNTTRSYGTSGYATDRLTQVVEPTGSQINIQYQSPTATITYRDQNSAGDRVLKSHALYDGFGRLLESDTFEGSQYIATAQTYDALGRIATKMNPSRSGDGLNYATQYAYDALNRISSVIAPDGSPTTTTYTGNQTTVQDAQQHVRQTNTDALGRLTNVVENPGSSPHLNYGTTYSYDVLDDLTGVNQSGRMRSFAYDSLKRLTSASNPESGTVRYTYDNDGNLLTRTDNRGIVTSYTYDALNRAQWKQYSDSTPWVNFIYDPAVPNGMGQLGSVANAYSVTNFTSFDAAGRILGSNQVTGGRKYSFSYGYNLAGSLTSETYPSGRVVSTGYDGANRPVTVTGNLSGQQSNYITQAAYWPQGDLYYFTRGNGVWHAAGYNSLLQPTEMYESLNNVNSTGNMLLISCLNWGSSRNFGGSLYNLCGSNNGTANNNGSLQGYTMMNGGPGSSQFVTFNQTFGYDNANRLIWAADSGGWSRNFGYDAYGNMWVAGNTGVILAGNTPTSQSQFTSNNQIAGNAYDAAGNLLSVNGNTANYDAENRLVQVTEAPAYGGATESLAYDGSGHRVEKLVPSAMSVYVYDAFGALAASYSSAAATAACKTCYLSTDHLGSVRLVTDQSGTVIARHDYLPFGEEIQANMAGRDPHWGPGNDTVNQKFTGKERDQETGLDYFGARYYGSALGRFTSPDPEGLGSSTMDPQSWNMYAYARNNPLSYIDPYGFSYQICDASGKNCAKDQLSDDEFDQQKHAAQGNGEVFDNGTMYHTDANGNKVVDGTYRQTDVDLPGDAGTNRAAAGFIVASFNQAMKEFGKNAAFAVAGAGIGAGIEAINDARLASKAAAEAEDLARYRTAPVGRPGSPMEVGGNTGTEINGRYYTGHALDRMQGRGLVPSVVEDTIATGTKSAGNTPGTSVYTSSQARVVVNSGGDVVSVSPR